MANPTIDNVAQLAGVSIKTVSRVVNQEPNVKQQTRDKVQAAIDELGYKPNLSARSLASKRSYLVSLLYDNFLAASAYVVNLQCGVIERCRQEGYELLIHPCQYRKKEIGKEIKTLIEQVRPDGIVLAAPLSKADLEAQMQEACKQTWAAYRTAYRLRHGVDPVRNAKVNTNVRDLVKRLGREEAPQVAGWFLSVNEQYAVKRMHDLGVLLAGAEAYRTQWATNRQVTETSARHTDQTQSNLSAADEAIELLRSRRPANAV